MTITLPEATWQTIMLMLAEHPVPRHAAFPAIHALEVAMQQARMPTTTPAPDDQTLATSVPEGK